MFKIKFIVFILCINIHQYVFNQSAIGQLENMTGQKINRYNTSNSSGYNMNSMITEMFAQSMINSIFNSNKKNYVTVKEAKVQPTYLISEIEGEQYNIEQKLKIEKYNRLMKTYKFLKDSTALKYTTYKEKEAIINQNKKLVCTNAQKEINRLNTLKEKFQKQFYELEKWNTNLDGYKKEFIDNKNKNTEGWVDNVLDVLPIDVIKTKAENLVKAARTNKELVEASKLLNQTKKLEQALSKTKMINSSTNLYIKNSTEFGLNDKKLDQIILSNENFTQTGVMVEELAQFGGKYKEPLSTLGKALQVDGGILKIYDDVADGKKLETSSDYFEVGGKSFQNMINVVGMFCPLVRITTAGEQLVEKAAYAAISEYAIHQMTTSSSQNQKAQDFLKNKMLDIENKIKLLEPIILEYKKINPAGCPIIN